MNQNSMEEFVKIVKNLEDGDIVFIDPASGIDQDELVRTRLKGLPRVVVFFCHHPHETIMHVPLNREPGEKRGG